MRKLQNILLTLIVIISALLHFYALPQQEFLGDDAAPMLLIDRMWDGISLKDIRFFAYPFLFYNEPYRSIFSGTLLHLLGPNRIVLRLPSITFGLSTLFLLIWIFKKEKISPWIIVFSIAAYSISPLLINDRSGGGDAQARFLFLLTGYLLWQASRQNSIQKLRLSLITFSAGLLTMLDAFALLPGMIVIFWKKRTSLDKKTIYLISAIIILFCLYFLIWLKLPYLAYKSGFQNYYGNRGLLYYFSRVNEGVSSSPLNGIHSLTNYTSILFTLWIAGTSLLALKIKRFLYIYIVSLSAWAAVTFLNHSSSHMVMYAGFFLFQAVIVTDYYFKKFPIIQTPLILFLSCIIITNSQNLFTNYFAISRAPVKLIYIQKLNCLDTSVVRLYKDHGKIPSRQPCESPASK
jgi:hypothetical protein